MEKDIFKEERKYFGALEKWVYLDHPTFGLLPQYSINAMEEYLTGRNAEGVHIQQFWDMWNRADAFRSVLGKMIGCCGTEIVYGQSSTQLFNIFANGIGLKDGDNVVTTDTVYPADAYTFLNQKDAGVELRFAKTTASGISPEELMSYTDEHTKAVLVCMVESKTGWRHDVKRIGTLCHEKNILFAVDATQAVNVVKIDVKDMQIDFLTTSLYKWMMGEQGHGFAYISPELLPHLSQSICGWVGTVDRTHNIASELKLCSEAKRFELGGISFSAQVGLEKVVEHYLAIGGERIEEQVQSLVQHVYDRARELKRFTLCAKFPKENRSGIVMFYIPEGVRITDEMLAEKKIRARVFQGTMIRAGFHYINSLDDADCLIDVLRGFESSL